VSVKVGSFTPSATGNVSVSGLSFLPTNVIFSAGPRFNTTETVIKYCRGWMTANNQSYDSLYQDSTGSRSKGGTDKSIVVWDRVSGTITDKVVGTFVSFDNNGGGDFGFTMNFTAADSNYQVRYIASDA